MHRLMEDGWNTRNLAAFDGPSNPSTPQVNGMMSRLFQESAWIRVDCPT